ncbi:hypothetical protein GN244_ATG15135 [Phytophthora infestans]|uniref:Uncharacterized protein n=1 Tax=Phytophthora infestans TaxID=4787 RepID=A0A833W8N6_PHYIN|nr:hypothetical protein GN244_ATG15135 [Phytophthora infestans]
MAELLQDVDTPATANDGYSIRASLRNCIMRHEGRSGREVASLRVAPSVTRRVAVHFLADDGSLCTSGYEFPPNFGLARCVQLGALIERFRVGACTESLSNL